MDVMGLTSFIALYILLTVAVLSDLKQTRVSNRLILVGLAVAFTLRILGDGVGQIYWVILNILFPVLVLYLLFLAGILGAGDIKLFSLIGGFLNFRDLLGCMCMSFIFAAIFALIRLIYTGQLARRIKRGLIYICEAVQGDLKQYQVEENDDILHFAVFEMCGVTAVLVYHFLEKYI